MVQWSRGHRRRPALCSPVTAVGTRRSRARGSTWSDQQPARIEGFEIYGDAAEGRTVSTGLELPDPPDDAQTIPWSLRATDIDLHGHLNNAVYWQAVEHVLASSHLDPARPLVAELDYRRPIDAEDEVELVAAVEAARVLIAFRAGDGVRAAARLEAR